MRLRGFRELKRQAEMTVNPAWCVVANYRSEPAYDQCVSILSGSERPTVILPQRLIVSESCADLRDP